MNRNKKYSIAAGFLVALACVAYAAWYTYDRHEKIAQAEKCNDMLTNPPKPTMMTAPDGTLAPVYSINGCAAVVVPPSLWNLLRGRMVFGNVPERMKVNEYSFTDIVLGRYTFGPVNIACDQSATTTDCSTIVPQNPIMTTNENTITPVTLVDGTKYYPGIYHASPVVDGLKSYTSNQFGISFNYSPDYVLFENMTEGGPQARYNYVAGSIVMGLDLPVRESIARAEAGFGGGAPSGIVLTFFLKSDQATSLEAWLRSNPNGNFNPAVDPDAERTLTSATVAGMPAFTYHSDMGMYATDYAVFSYGNWFVQASSGDTEGDGGEKTRSDFETVLSSIKLQ